MDMRPGCFGLVPLMLCGVALVIGAAFLWAGLTTPPSAPPPARQAVALNS